MEIKLNLIPQRKKDEISAQRRLGLIWRAEIFLTIGVVFFLGILLSFRYILDLNLKSGSNYQMEEGKLAQYEKIKNLDNYFLEVNSQISNIATIKRGQIYWSNLFEKMEQLVFPGINLDMISTSDYFVTIKGKSKTRDDLILFKEKLEHEECFLDVDLPLSNLVEKNDIEFQIDFEIKKDCLKKAGGQ